ncbi:hypothetical protein [Flavobacterium bizetiae]|uniref:hypothetical protein n=1 Tax=Flavobacterium bizetiae TaxID=2704140 RepID=UPI00174E238D|nr:hypothetical protein [Flavobacterium bizetiae]
MKDHTRNSAMIGDFDCGVFSHSFQRKVCHPDEGRITHGILQRLAILIVEFSIAVFSVKFVILTKEGSHAGFYKDWQF